MAIQKGLGGRLPVENKALLKLSTGCRRSDPKRKVSDRWTFFDCRLFSRMREV
ncbi:hypothetical protein DESC_310075 [Desulfosarcina cetonica]|nr:hypothetical protein DESC_310075 [Desulfosarcina cetonica]